MKQTRAMMVDGRYLNVPINAGAPRRLMKLEIDGEVVRAFEVELATDTQVDFWAFVDVSAWQGVRLNVTLDAKPTNLDERIQNHSAAHPLLKGALEVLEISKGIKEGENLYKEKLRPQFHFTVRRGWHNDPNGMFFYAGEYHLFYQHQPFSVSSFSDKSWGHAVSLDLVHWEERPVALHSDHEGQKWSGSGVVDAQNVSGLQQGEQPPLLLFYTATGDGAQNPTAGTGTGFVQSIAYSNDRGNTWETYADNPVLENLTPGNRDPLVFWHEPTQRWVMTLFVGRPESWLREGNQVAAQIFTSVDLKVWRYESTVDGFFDCPGLFSLPLDGDETDLRWVMHSADMKYKVGRFDGRVFTPDTDFIVGQIGDCAYAPQLFNHAPEGRRIQIAWGRTEAPGMPFSQIMNFPCDLSMITTDEGPRMCWRPVREIENLYQASTSYRDEVLTGDAEPIELARGQHFDLQVVIDVGESHEVEIDVCGISLVCDILGKQIKVLGCAAPLNLQDGKLNLRLLLDRISLEVFADAGLIYMPLAVVVASEKEMITMQARGGNAMVERFECHELRSIWSDE